MLNRTRQTFIVSDLHFGHANIIKYCNRPYTVVKGNRAPENKPVLAAMKEDMLKMFDFLPDDCDIWNLGDFYFAGSGDPNKVSDEVILELQEIVKRMKKTNRRLFLVMGNHDHLHFKGQSRIDFYYKLGFDKVYDTPVLVDEKYILSHEPVYLKPGSNLINLYGHTHDLSIKEDYFTFDYENYAMECRVFDKMGQARPPITARYPERVIDLKNYKNMCLDFNNGVLEWTGDYFKQAALCWRNKEKKDENNS